MNVEIKGDSHRTVEMKIHLVLLLMAAKSVPESGSNCHKNVYPHSEESLDISDGSDTEDPDDPEGMMWGSVQDSTELSSKDRNITAESYPSDKFSEKTGFASENKNPTSKSDGRLSRMDCRRCPESKPEWLIGFAFVLLCEYCGPRVRDEIDSGLESEVVLGRCEEELEDLGDTGGYDFGWRTYAMAFEIQKPALARCFRSAHDYYCPNSSAEGTSSSCISRYPACLRQLAIHPQPDFQILWMRNYPRMLKYFDRVRKGQRTFRRATAIAQELLKQGLMDWWMRSESVDWAKSKVAAWKGSMFQNRNKTLKEILQEGPRLSDVCSLVEILLLESWYFGTSDCLIRIVSNLLVLEGQLQEDGESLEMEFFGGNVLPLNVLYSVKNVLEENKALKYLKKFDNLEELLKAVIQSILQGGVLEDDLSNYPWAKEFLTKWKSSVIENLNLRLLTIFSLTKGGIFGKSCLPLTRNKMENSQCWRRITAEIVLVESELIKNGLSLRSMFLDDPLLANFVSLINKILRENNGASDGNGMSPVLRTFTSSNNEDPISRVLKPGELLHLLDDAAKDNETKSLNSLSTEPPYMSSQKEKEELAKKVAHMFDIPLLVNTIIDGLSNNLQTLFNDVPENSYLHE